jgi:Fe-S cluster assembly protein SufD
VTVLIRPEDFAVPSRRVEAWKYSDLYRHMRALPPPSPALDAAVPAGGPLAVEADAEIVIANGRLNWWPEGRLPDGVAVFEHHAPGAMSVVAAMPLAQLAAEHPAGPLTIVEVSGAQPRTLRLRWVSRAEGTGHSGRVGVVVKSGATLTLLESFEGAGEGYFANSLTEILLQPRARIERLCLSDEPASALSVASCSVGLSAGTSFSQTVLATGAKLQRHETHVAHPGQGASVRLDGLYVLGGDRHADLTTVVEHSGVGGETRQLTKGVVADRARGVFQGRIVVEHGADKTDARMGHHALILSDRAEVDAKPELEIYADDVACAHGNTVGALDENALFYAKARGIPEAQARAMLTEAFLGEVADRIEDEQARDFVRGWLSERLERLS